MDTFDPVIMDLATVISAYFENARIDYKKSNGTHTAIITGSKGNDTYRMDFYNTTQNALVFRPRRITEYERNRIIAMLVEGTSQKDIGLAVGRSQATISRVKADYLRSKKFDTLAKEIKEHENDKSNNEEDK